MCVYSKGEFHNEYNAQIPCVLLKYICLVFFENTKQQYLIISDYNI